LRKAFRSAKIKGEAGEDVKVEEMEVVQHEEDETPKKKKKQNQQT
jgi:hypothetical protein